MTKSISRLKKDLDGLLRDYIRNRDHDQCQHCLKKVYGINSHPSHVKPKSTHGFLRFDPMNIKLLCYHCHRNWWHLNPTEAGIWFKKTFPERHEYLEKQGHQIKEWKRWELEELIGKWEKEVR